MRERPAEGAGLSPTRTSSRNNAGRQRVHPKKRRSSTKSLPVRLAAYQHQRDNRLLTLGHHPPLAIPFLAPNPVFEINPQGVGLRASPCRRVDSSKSNAPGDVSQASSLRGPVARGMVPRLQDRSQTDVSQRCSRFRVDGMRRPIAATLMVSIVVFQAGDGTFGAVPADEIDGDEVAIISEYDPFG